MDEESKKETWQLKSGVPQGPLLCSVRDDEGLVFTYSTNFT